MRIRGLVVTLLVLSGATLGSGSEIRFAASDGVRVYATHASVGPRTRGLILLFHQAGSSRAEYDRIAPRLNALGFGTLAVDQRSGGGSNKTATEFGQYASYLEALPDLEAALGWAHNEGKSERVIALGSSYSAALVFLLAAKHPGELAAVMAFSPDEYLRPITAVRDAAKQVRVPVFVTSARNEADAAKRVLEAVAGGDRVQFVPKGEGIHGASALDLPDGSAEYWKALKAFLARFE
jgi:pimeloyl-ACP methyl ester carboxylesterase